jgi:glycosidase
MDTIKQGAFMPSKHLVLKDIGQILKIIYSGEVSETVYPKLKELMDRYAGDEMIRTKRAKFRDRPLLTEKDAFLITYPDNIHLPGENPLSTLRRFLDKHVKDAVSGLHILPFFPSSSDAGYAVIDYKSVEPSLGTWEDIKALSKKYRLMVDLVMNHVSSQSNWFKAFLEGDKVYRDFFIWREKMPEMPEVFRPRETPLFTPFETAWGKKAVWTTFGPDQIDLNYKNPEVLLRIIDVLLFYLSKGAEVIRFDAIGYVWKEPGTRCVNLSKTHQIVRLLRHVLAYAAPYALILTEANFPYKENIAYFGEGHEANMVYKFSLPPLVVDAFARRDTAYIKEITNRTRPDLLFFDFLASHDGIGLMSAREILSKDQFDNLLRLTEDHGGLISYKTTKEGEKSPYELNISYFDAINDPSHLDDPLAVERFSASQAVMLALKGVPGIYIHSLLGSRNDLEAVNRTGEKRMINRAKLAEDDLETALADDQSLRHRVLRRFVHLLKAREAERAFHPLSKRKVWDRDKRLLVIERTYKGDSVWVVINVSEDEVSLPELRGKTDTISRKRFSGRSDPYGVYFLR